MAKAVLCLGALSIPLQPVLLNLPLKEVCFSLAYNENDSYNQFSDSRH
jgi:hypothetical protein